MSDDRVFNQDLSVGRNTGWIGLRGTRDGAAYVAGYPLSAAIEGRAFGCHFGTLTTPLTTPATSAITTLRPQAWVRIPDGTAIIPLAINITVESSGITTQGEISFCTTTVDPGDGTAAAGTQQPVSLNTARPVSSNCTTRQLATGDITAETGLLELRRFSFALSTVNADYPYRPYQDGVYPYLRGPAGLLVYIGGNAVLFYCQMQWIELPE